MLSVSRISPAPSAAARRHRADHVRPSRSPPPSVNPPRPDAAYACIERDHRALAARPAASATSSGRATAAEFMLHLSAPGEQQPAHVHLHRAHAAATVSTAGTPARRGAGHHVQDGVAVLMARGDVEERRLRRPRRRGPSSATCSTGSPASRATNGRPSPRGRPSRPARWRLDITISTLMPRDRGKGEWPRQRPVRRGGRWDAPRPAAFAAKPRPLPARGDGERHPSTGPRTVAGISLPDADAAPRSAAHGPAPAPRSPPRLRPGCGVAQRLQIRKPATPPEAITGVGHGTRPPPGDEIEPAQHPSRAMSV